MEIKASVFVSFISFIVVSPHRVQVSCTSSYISKTNLFFLMQLMLHNINCQAALPTALLLKLYFMCCHLYVTDAMQMLPSAVNIHR